MGRRGVVVMVPRIPSSAARPTGEALSRLWELFTEHAGPAWRESTARNYARTRALSRGMPDQPSPGDIVVWLTALRATGMQETTVAHHRWNLHHVFEYGRDAGWTTANPVAVTKFRRTEPKRVALERIEHVWPFIEACAVDDRERAFLGVLRFCGLRKGEVLGLVADDVDTQREPWVLHVRRQRKTNARTLSEAGPLKTFDASRALPVRAPLQPLLAAVLKLPAARVRTGFGGGVLREVPWLFPYREHELGELVTRLRGVVPDGFPGGDAWHVFRHTVAVELERSGRTIQQIAEWLGHTSIAKCAVYLRGLCGKRLDVSVIHGLDPPRKEVRKRARPASTDRAPTKFKT